MNEHCDNCFAPKRKTGLHITGARINAKRAHRINHNFCKRRDLSPSHLERPCDKGYNVAHSGYRTVSHKENLNRSSLECGRDVSFPPLKRTAVRIFFSTYYL